MRYRAPDVDFAVPVLGQRKFFGLHATPTTTAERLLLKIVARNPHGKPTVVLKISLVIIEHVVQKMTHIVCKIKFEKRTAAAAEDVLLREPPKRFLAEAVAALNNPDIFAFLLLN